MMSRLQLAMAISPVGLARIVSIANTVQRVAVRVVFVLRVKIKTRRFIKQTQFVKTNDEFASYRSGELYDQVRMAGHSGWVCA